MRSTRKTNICVIDIRQWNCWPGALEAINARSTDTAAYWWTEDGEVLIFHLSPVETTWSAGLQEIPGPEEYI